MPRGNKKNTSGAGSIRRKTVVRNGTDYTYWEARFTTGFDPKTGKQKQRSITGKRKKKLPRNCASTQQNWTTGLTMNPLK